MNMAARISVLASAVGLLLASAAQAGPYDALVFNHAPIHFQDSDSSDYPSDYITAFDYDSDRVSTNNWDNRSGGQWLATVYYSVVESCSHYFINYAFFH